MGVGKANQGQLWDSRIHLKISHFKKSTPVDWVGQQPGNPTGKRAEATGVRMCLAKTICRNSHPEINPKFQQAKQQCEKSFVS